MSEELKAKAITLRKAGNSYTEIIKQIPVAKSTLSVWLRTVQLSTPQQQRLTNRRYEASVRGGVAKKEKRIKHTAEIKKTAILEVGDISKRELWVMGIMLYWGEGAKSKEHNVSQGMIFSNSDPMMVKMYLTWLIKCLEIPIERIKFEIYIHEEYKTRLPQIGTYWATVTGFSIAKFSKIYFKRHSVKTNRKNKGDKYYGMLRVKTTRSTDLNRKVTGWIEGIYKQCGVV